MGSTHLRFMESQSPNLFDDGIGSNKVKPRAAASQGLRFLANLGTLRTDKQTKYLKDKKLFEEEYAKASKKLIRVKRSKNTHLKIVTPSNQELYDDYKQNIVVLQKSKDESMQKLSSLRHKITKKKTTDPLLLSSLSNILNKIPEVSEKANNQQENHTPTNKISSHDFNINQKSPQNMTKIKVFESLSSLEKYHPEINFYKKETDKPISHDLKS